ncbi:deacetylase [Sporanaerobium hydrogeniformans]|uniref:Deacetylase n=2 Tax=Sporanaerobium hydrogeniformans TaxID=3072179 RepID=A0AC61DCG3_9FIRM|nr:deacetylase [Sporanaerobium hydrogeniformans]
MLTFGTLLSCSLVSQGASIHGFYKSKIEVAEAKRLLPIYCVDTNGEKKVALTFDAAWGAEDLTQIVEILEKYQVRATFFVVGDWARKYPEEVKLLIQKGHDVANHSNKHPHMNSMSKEEIKKDIMAADASIKEIAGKETKLFRPPYGEYNNTVVEATKECGYYCIQWDVDSLDWKNYGVQPLIDKVVNHKNLRPGSIILMHNGAKYTAQALEAIIKGVQDKGFIFVPVSELLLADEEYSIDFEGRQKSSQPIH